MKFGIDVLLEDTKLLDCLKTKRVGLVGHPASVTKSMIHSLDALVAKSVPITCAFGPQHGMRGEKQYNMIESEDYVDPVHKIPVFSLYGQSRIPTVEMLSHCDLVLVDLQDVGCRIYTYLTTLGYVLQACAKEKKEVWVLDRPNPAGRKIEGMTLEAGQESFVGLAPMPMRHGLTLGEFAPWIQKHFQLNVEFKVIPMQGYDLSAPGFGWPQNERAWVNPSPNIPNLASTRVYPGTVLLEGTTLCEGRGTTRPFEIIGAPDIDASAVLSKMNKISAPWIKGAACRGVYFEPTFYKHQGKLCSGIQIHAEGEHYQPEVFSPYRFTALFFKAIRTLYPKYDLWRDFAYEYVTDRLAIDVINGGTFLRKWVDDSSAKVSDLEDRCLKDEKLWKEQIQNYIIYQDQK